METSFCAFPVRQRPCAFLQSYVFSVLFSSLPRPAAMDASRTPETRLQLLIQLDGLFETLAGTGLVGAAAPAADAADIKGTAQLAVMPTGFALLCVAAMLFRVAGRDKGPPPRRLATVVGVTSVGWAAFLAAVAATDWLRLNAMGNGVLGGAAGVLAVFGVGQLACIRAMVVR